MKSPTPKQDAYYKSIGKLSPFYKEQFLDLACQLSPENISCDGELPRSEVQKRYKHLMAQWHHLESLVGRKVDESEVWS